MLSSPKSSVYNYFKKVDSKSAICFQFNKTKSSIDSTVNRFVIQPIYAFNMFILFIYFENKGRKINKKR
jgi:hypothetical protein